MNSAEAMARVKRVVPVATDMGIIAHFRPCLAGEAAQAGLLPTDAKMVSKMSPDEEQVFKEQILERAKPLILKCGVDPVFVDGPADEKKGIASYEWLSEDDIIGAYLAIMDGASDVVDAIHDQFPSADRNQETIAHVAYAFKLNPIDLETIPLPEWIRLLRYAKLCGAIKEKEVK